MYDAKGGIPALSEVKFSLTSNRGCFGGCSFCALTFHQGRILQTRSHESIVAEAKKMTEDPEFKGYIHDVGGPRQIFGIPPVKNSSRRVSVNTGSACFPHHAPILRQTMRTMSVCFRKLRAIPKVKSVYPLRRAV